MLIEIVVGYTTLKIESQYQIIGVNFQAVNGGNLKLNDAIPYQEGMTWSNAHTDADQIQIGDDSGNWATYYISNGRNAKNNKDIPEIKGKWCYMGEYTATEVALKPGDSFWYVRKDATQPAFNLTIAGQVTTLPSASYAFASQYRIFSNPYTVPMKLDDYFPYDEQTMTWGNAHTETDQIQIGDDSGNWTTYYISNGRNAKNNKDIPEIKGKWCHMGEYVVSNAEIPVGKAAWYVRKDTSKPAMQVNWTKPYDL